MNRPRLFLLGLTFALALTGCKAPQTGQFQRPDPTGTLPPTETPEAAITQPAETAAAESTTPAPEESNTGADAALPPEPTADMLNLEGLDAALFAGAYEAYFGQEWIASFEDFPRIVLPHINVLGAYEDGGTTYYVCDIMYKLHYYDEETKQFDDNAGSLATPCRIGLIDKGNGAYDLKDGLMPPSGGQYASVTKEVFGPLDELYQQYTSGNADTLEPVRVLPSSDELWEMYLNAAHI